MSNREAVLEKLDTLGIRYALHEHPPVHTVDDCLLVPGIDWSKTEIAKNAFLCNRQQTTFYLMLLRHDVPFRTAVVSKALGVSRLSFAPDSLLPEMLGLTAGAVSPMGLLFDKENRVTLVCDEGLKDFEYLAFHPCVNTATIVLKSDDFVSVFLSGIDRRPIWVTATKEETV